MELLNDQIDREALKCYIESAALEDLPLSFAKLQHKVEEYAKYKEAIECFIDVIDRYPDKESLYTAMISSCCSPIWNLGQTLNASSISKIEACETVT